jgi:hypothetical protein
LLCSFSSALLGLFCSGLLRCLRFIPQFLGRTLLRCFGSALLGFCGPVLLGCRGLLARFARPRRFRLLHGRFRGTLFRCVRFRRLRSGLRFAARFRCLGRVLRRCARFIGWRPHLRVIPYFLGRTLLGSAGPGLRGFCLRRAALLRRTHFLGNLRLGSLLAGRFNWPLFGLCRSTLFRRARFVRLCSRFRRALLRCFPRLRSFDQLLLRLFRPPLFGRGWRTLFRRPYAFVTWCLGPLLRRQFRCLVTHCFRRANAW